MPDAREDTAAAFDQIAAQITALDDLMNRTYCRAEPDIVERFEATQHLWRMMPARAGIEATRLAAEIRADLAIDAAHHEKERAA